MLKIIFDTVWTLLVICIVGGGAHLLIRKIEKRAAWTVEDSQDVARHISASIIVILAILFYFLVPLALTFCVYIQLDGLKQIFGLNQKYQELAKIVYSLTVYYIFVLNSAVCSIVQRRFLRRMRYWRYISYLAHLSEPKTSQNATSRKILRATKQLKVKALKRLRALRKLRINLF